MFEWHAELGPHKFRNFLSIKQNTVSICTLAFIVHTAIKYVNLSTFLDK